MPKSLQAKAKGHLQDIWMAETKVEAEGAFDFFVEAYGVKYDKAVERLVKGSRTIADILRFPGRALETHPHHQPHREHVRHGAPANREDKKTVCREKRHWPWSLS